MRGRGKRITSVFSHPVEVQYSTHTINSGDVTDWFRNSHSQYIVVKYFNKIRITLHVNKMCTKSVPSL